MPPKPLLEHALDFFKGLLAVMAVQAGLAALQYVGAHIPDMINTLTSLAAAVTTIRVTKA